VEYWPATLSISSLQGLGSAILNTFPTITLPSLDFEEMDNAFYIGIILSPETHDLLYYSTDTILELKIGSEGVQDKLGRLR